MTLGRLAETLNIYPSVIYIYLNNLKNNVIVNDNKISKIKLSEKDVDYVLTNYITVCKDHNRLVHKLCGIKDNTTLTIQEISKKWVEICKTHTTIHRYGCVYLFANGSRDEEEKFC